MSSFSISQVLLDVLRKAVYCKLRPSLTLPRDDKWPDAVDLVTNIVVEGYLPPLAGIRGPPGTGKTSIYGETYYRILNAEERRDLADLNMIIIYTAPTNQLVVETFSKFICALWSVFKDIKTVVSYLVRRVRVYGSRIVPLGPEAKIILTEAGIDVMDLKKITGQVPTPSEADGPVFIFTTEWQRVGLRTREASRVELLVDEASRSPFYRPFITVADIIYREVTEGSGKTPMHALIVTGDPEQAIALEPEYQLESKRLLVMNRIEHILLRELNLSRNYVFLNYTKRLPKPTHEPISVAYYDRKLNAMYEPEQVLKDLELDALRKAYNILSNNLGDTTLLGRLYNLAENIVSSRIPIGVINVDAFPPGDTFEGNRIKIGVYLALLFALLSQNLNLPLTISVIAPYAEIPVSMELYFHEKARSVNIKRIHFPRFATVQSMLGGESDIVIAVLGKEWVKRDELENRYLTVYYREPELLNVQLSRHKRVIIIIGDLRTMRSCARKLAQELGLRERYQELSDIRRALLGGAKKINNVCKEIEETLIARYGAPQIDLRRSSRGKLK